MRALARFLRARRCDLRAPGYLCEAWPMVGLALAFIALCYLGAA